MSGTPAERNLLGALILDGRQLREVEDLVSDVDFTDARMGSVFANVSRMLSAGEPVDAVIVDGALDSWGVRGLSTEPHKWASADVYPFAATEYARSVRSAAIARGIRNVADVSAELIQAGAAPLDVATKAAGMLSDLIDGSSSGLLGTKTLAEVLDGSDAYDWVIPDLLERKDRLVVTGPEGSGKTTWVRQLAVLSAAGVHPVTFRPMLPVRVLVVDAENTERQWRRAVRYMASRAREVGSIDPAPAINIVAGHRIDITRGSHLAEIHRLIDRHKPDVLFIGPLYKLVPKAINSDDDAAPLIVGLDSIRERDVALVMEAHAGKATGSNGERDLRPRGSAALLGWPEFGFGLQSDGPPNDPFSRVHIQRWRGDRDPVRKWPAYLERGLEWPWIPA